MRDDPILICGCPGSGTSLLARMLRNCGVFLGADAGSIDDRKFHESSSFRDANNKILSWTINYPHAPKGVHQIQQHVERLKKHAAVLKKMIDVDSLLDHFWGDQDRQQPWGWKDPRNSANLIFWQSIFPNLRIIILERKWRSEIRNEPVRSVSGQWFRLESDPRIRKAYLQPEGIGHNPTVLIDFDRLLLDEKEINQALVQLGLSDHQIGNFQEFGEKVGIETGSNPSDV